MMMMIRGLHIINIIIVIVVVVIIVIIIIIVVVVIIIIIIIIIITKSVCFLVYYSGKGEETNSANRSDFGREGVLEVVNVALQIR